MMRKVMLMLKTTVTIVLNAMVTMLVMVLVMVMVIVIVIGMVTVAMTMTIIVAIDGDDDDEDGTKGNKKGTQIEFSMKTAKYTCFRRIFPPKHFVCFRLFQWRKRRGRRSSFP